MYLHGVEDWGTTGVITLAGALDHEATDNYSVTVDVFDGANTTPKTFTPEKAAALIDEMATADPDWTYTIDADPTGRSPWVRIKITDEEGEFVAFYR